MATAKKRHDTEAEHHRDGHGDNGLQSDEDEDDDSQHGLNLQAVQQQQHNQSTIGHQGHHHQDQAKRLKKEHHFLNHCSTGPAIVGLHPQT